MFSGTEILTELKPVLALHCNEYIIVFVQWYDSDLM